MLSWVMRVSNWTQSYPRLPFGNLGCGRLPLGYENTPGYHPEPIPARTRRRAWRLGRCECVGYGGAVRRGFWWGLLALWPLAAGMRGG